MTMVFMPEARKPVICDAVKPLALPMPPLQKIIAVVAATRWGATMPCARTNNRLAELHRRHARIQWRKPGVKARLGV